MAVMISILIFFLSLFGLTVFTFGADVLFQNEDGRILTGEKEPLKDFAYCNKSTTEKGLLVCGCFNVDRVSKLKNVFINGIS